MKDQKLTLITGALLHDIGKVLFRCHEGGKTHSESGAEWLKEIGISNRDILNQVKYHHSKEIRSAGTALTSDASAYITYWADNVAAGADRRDNDAEQNGQLYVRNASLESVFNILNGNKAANVYASGIMSDDGSINYPTSESKTISPETYSRILDNIKDALKDMTFTEKSINSLLEVLEANLSFVPSSTDSSQLCDISLFDHIKITAAVASALFDYAEENRITDYKNAFYSKGSAFYDEQAFLLCSMDISGIQNFIYTIAATKALKNLRARSFYLELMMEHIADQLLDRLELSRANLLYTGGGHAYLLLPNTAFCKDSVKDFHKDLNQWLLKNFGIDLYMAFGYAGCSANELMNQPSGSYREIFHRISEKLSYEKSHRYTAGEIAELNAQEHENHEHECSICGRSSRLVNENKCEVCDALEALANDIIEKDFIVVLSEKPSEKALILPGNCYMLMENREQVRVRMQEDESYLRCYGKNKRFTGENLSAKLWIGDYSSAKEFAELASAAQGIKRLAVLRADVDNLGQAFVAGFDDKNTSISRTATFSRKLSEFFKLHINYILQNPQFSFGNDAPQQRNALIVYSGGDDVFLIGAWDDVIGFAIDLQNSMQKYTQGTLTISAGIGLYPEKYPVSAMAYETGLLEELSKGKDGKNAVTLFEGEHTYHWDCFRDKVIGEKLDLINRYFAINHLERGNSMLYKLLEYIRSLKEDKINLARYAYLLARLKPAQDDEERKEKIYQEFSQNMYRWIKNEDDRKELITAIYLYVYLNRSKEGEDGKADAN